MCGIAGFIDLRCATSQEELIRFATEMAAAIHYRGPDSFGAWGEAQTGIALGHRRLAIIDLTEEGHQPMHSASQRYVMVFNGEIYNFLQLRENLEGKGCQFRGHSDTEVMLAAFDVWGIEEALHRFVGMFAFAVWDRQTRQLILARDRAGEKPLYYGRAGDLFLFGSELNSLAAHPGFVPEIDRDALTLFMRYAFIPAPHSIFQGIRKLLPGTMLVIDENGSEVETVTYWSAQQAAEAGVADPFNGTPEEAVAELDRLLRAAVKGQMIADVPLGAFLSGGIDSSAIVALMQAQSTRPIKTYSIGFTEEAYNEAPFAKRVAEHLQTDHTERYVTPQEALAVIPRLPTIYNEPFADPSQIPTYLVCEMARRHVTVSLSGDAGDELFAGYNRYREWNRTWSRLGRIPYGLRKAASRSIRAIGRDTWDTVLSVSQPILPFRADGKRLSRLGELLDMETGYDMYLASSRSYWAEPMKVVRDSRELQSVYTDATRWATMPDQFNQILYLDFIGYLPDDILAKVDRAAMSVSLETRIPLLDHRIIEFAWRLPASYKTHNGIYKWPLRQLLYNYVPQELIERPKSGFGIPLGEWLRGPLRGWAEALLDETRLVQEGYLDARVIRDRWADFIEGRRGWTYAIWTVLMFQQWRETHLAA